ncbi:MAG: hypothetical protein ACYCT3_11230 [Acidiferrobacter sp.]
MRDKLETLVGLQSRRHIPVRAEARIGRSGYPPFAGLRTALRTWVGRTLLCPHRAPQDRPAVTGMGVPAGRYRQTPPPRNGGTLCRLR